MNNISIQGHEVIFIDFLLYDILKLFREFNLNFILVKRIITVQPNIGFKYQFLIF